MALNKWIGYGRLTKDPDFRQTTSGVAVCRFTIAIDRRRNKDGENQTDFIECVAWRQTAEFVSRYFTKGKAIIVEGTLQNNNYEDKNGVKHYSYVVLAENVSFGESKNSQSTQHNTQAEQNARDIQAAIGDLGEFEEILSDGEVPF